MAESNIIPLDEDIFYGRGLIFPIVALDTYRSMSLFL